jgi:UDP-glucose 6-dehydrogenase
MKVQIFNEFYGLCQKLNVDYNNVTKMMLLNGWINPMHTQVPGPDGKLSYGGACFIKDTKALLAQMLHEDTPCAVLEATIEERDLMRPE